MSIDSKTRAPLVFQSRVGAAPGVVFDAFFRDPEIAHKLLAQMLPFTTSQPLELQAVQLVYQQGGYWVYKIPPTEPSSS